ncbi:MAG: type II toxin-antitoxin system HicA family toxin [Patescibacteria group bacterium]
MPRLYSISWYKFVRKMRIFGFSGPYQEGKHPYMIKGSVSVTIPNPHSGDISYDLLNRILKQAGISKISWINRR